MPLLITTSRRPSRRTRTFVKELVRVIPGSIKLNRGKLSIDDLRELMIKKGINKLLIIDTKKGNPSRLSFITLSPHGLSRKLVIEINGLTLQMDKNQRTVFSDLLGIKSRNVSPELLETLNFFFSLPPIFATQGSRGYVDIVIENSSIKIGFLDTEGRRVYPVIKGRVVLHEKGGL